MFDNTPLSSSPELLAPVGGWSQLYAAINYGADAIYLAPDQFGMRARADNFSLDDIKKVVQIAHASQVKVHVTLNILMNDKDIDQLPSYLISLREAGVDAFIISDLGAFSLAKRYAPDIDIHVSTQASVMNRESALMWYKLGAKRIVCAREMSITDIAQLKKEIPSDLELEVFVHGAMCVAYSGRCLLSSVMTGRSANRGACAQSCRWSYELVEEKRPHEYFPIEEQGDDTFILNSKDLNMIEHLQDLIDAGVSSFKIEGRNKQAFYVATVVGAYRFVLDGGDPQYANRELHTISHRPYSTGFYYGRAEQGSAVDGYIKECVHVGTVKSCTALNNGKYLIEAECLNRFSIGDELGVVSPKTPSFSIVVSDDLVWKEKIFPKDDISTKEILTHATNSCTEEKKDEKYCINPVEVANRSKEIYCFSLDRPLKSGDYLRRVFYDAAKMATRK